MATQIGVVKALIGEVTATAADGSIRTLQLGDMVYANELISTGEGGAIEIEFADGSVMDLGRNSQAMLDSGVFDPSATAVAETTTDEVPDDIAAIQQALLEGEDPTQVGEATAAGAGVDGGNEGHEAVFVDYLNPEVTPDAGFDTIGVSNSYELPEEDIIILEEEDPVGPVVSVSVDVEIEIDDPETAPPTDGIPTSDYPVLVEGNAASVLEGTSEGTKQVVFIINLSESFSQDVQVTYILQPVSTNGAADNPDDWFDGVSPQTVTIPAGETSFPVYVEIVEDRIAEGNGTFEIVLIDAVNATINPDASAATVTIYDDDTVPVAQDDTNTVMEDGFGYPDLQQVSDDYFDYSGEPTTSGNVISGVHDDSPFTSEAQEDTDEDGDTLEIVSFSDADETAAPGGTITGDYGTLTLNADGSYTYVLTSNLDPEIQGLSEGETLTDVFTYIVAEDHGTNAEQTATLTIIIEGKDDGVQIFGLSGEGAEEVVYEDDLADGSSPDAGALTQDGSFSFDAPDGFGDTGSVSIGGQVFTLAQLQALAGSNVTIGSAYGDLTLTGYTGDEFGGTVSYEYTLTANVDNDSQADASDSGYTDSFEVVVTDDDGSDDTASLDILIVDDEPEAVDDYATQGEEDSDVVYNVLTNGDGTSDEQGADSATLTNATVNTGLGSVSFLPNGQVTYDPVDGEEGQIIIDYTITDADGDTSDAQLFISLADDSTPTIEVVNAQVDETGGLDSDTQNFTTTYGNDSAGTLALSATGATWNGVDTLTADNGDWEIVVNGDGTYTVTQLQVMTHPDDSDPNDPVVVTVTADITDNEGDPAQDIFTVTFLDDGPVAADDSTSTAEDTVVTYNVLANDAQGADGATVTSVVSNNGLGSAVVSGTDSIQYTPAAGEEGFVEIVYEITDGDGDTSQATLTIEVGPDSVPEVTTTNVAVDETGGLDMVDGTLSVDYGNDTGAVTLSAANATWDGSNTLNADNGTWKIVVNNNGTYTFTQLLPMVHTGAEDAALVLNITATATDSDGDIVNDPFTVTVYDDGPVVTDYDGTINTDAASSLEVLDYDVGLDGLGSVSFSLAGSSVPLTSGGQAVLTESIDLGDGREQLVGYLESGANAGYQEGEDGVVFTIAPQSPDADPTDGTYELTLSSDNVLDLPQDTVELSFSGISAGSPQPFINVGSELTISAVDAGTAVNASNGFIGIDNNIMNDNNGGETIMYTFNLTLINDLQLDIKDVGGSGDTITWTTYNSADQAGTTDTGNLVINGDGLTDAIEADFDFDTIVFTVTGGDFKVGGITYTDTGDPQDILVQFDYQGQDSDGDTVNGSIDVTVTGIDSTTQTGSDILNHPDSQVDAS